MLLDGNVGIGGDPPALLRRLAQLLRVGGVAAVEVEPPGVTTETLQVRLDPGRGATGPWFPWSRVSADAIDSLGCEAGLAVDRVESAGGRWLAWVAKR